MSFAAAKEEKISDKIVLIEIDLDRMQKNWLNYCAGIWYYRFNTFKQNQEHSFGYGNFLFGPFKSSGIQYSGKNFTPFLMWDPVSWMERNIPKNRPLST